MSNKPLHIVTVFTNQNIKIMKKVRLEAGYYEWHLVDETGKILLNITDTNIDYAKTPKEILEAIDNVWEEAYDAIERGKDFNGIKQDYLDDDWKFVVAKKLFEHYGYGTLFLARVEKFRDEALSLGYCLQDLGILDWYILFEAAQES